MNGSPCQDIRVNTLGKIVMQLFEPFCAFGSYGPEACEAKFRVHCSRE
jgi:hypothetical protein